MRHQVRESSQACSVTPPLSSFAPLARALFYINKGSALLQSAGTVGKPSARINSGSAFIHVIFIERTCYANHHTML